MEMRTQLETEIAHFKLDPDEVDEVKRILGERSRRGGLVKMDAQGRAVLDGQGNPAKVYFVILRSRRFVVCTRGRIWRYRPRGTPTSAAPVRFSGIEMWFGGVWLRAQDPDGNPSFKKKLGYQSVEAGTSLPPGQDFFLFWEQRKGHKHPLSTPHEPSESEKARLNESKIAAEGAVYARMGVEAAKAGVKDPAQFVAEQAAVDPVLNAATKAALAPSSAPKAKKAKSRRKRRTAKPATESAHF